MKKVVLFFLFLFFVIYLAEGVILKPQQISPPANLELAGCVYHKTSPKGVGFMQCANDKPAFTFEGVKVR